MQASSVNLGLAFFAGLVSFLSPCVFPLVPAYIGYLSGSAVKVARGLPATSGATMWPAPAGPNAPLATRPASAPPTDTNMSSRLARLIVMLHALAFVAGLTFVFVVVIGGLAGGLSDHKREIQYVMGALLVVFGFHMLGIINIPFLNYTRRLDVRPATNLGYIRSFLIGAGFGLGWTPCIGPTLTLMFNLVYNGGQAQAFPLFLAYSIGLGLPFLIAAAALGQVSSGLKKLTRRSFSLKVGNFAIIKQVDTMSLITATLLIIMGVLVFTNSLTILTTLAPSIGSI